MVEALERAARGHVAAVEEGMDPDRHAGARDQVGQHHQMVLVRVHAARRGQPHQMAGAAVLLEDGDEAQKVGVLRQRAILDRIVDARQVGHGHPAGAEIHVADLGVAHLALGQSDEGLGRVDQALRAGCDQPLVVRSTGVQDGVVRPVGTMAPAVQDAEDGGTRTIAAHYDALPFAGALRSTELNLLGQ